AEDVIRDFHVTGVQTCALPIYTTRRNGAGIAAGAGILAKGWDAGADARSPRVQAWSLRSAVVARGALHDDLVAQSFKGHQPDPADALQLHVTLGVDFRPLLGLGTRPAEAVGHHALVAILATTDIQNDCHVMCSSRCVLHP